MKSEEKKRLLIKLLCSPALSFILDTDDLNWRDFFNPEEIKELRNYGEPVLRRIPDCMKLKLEEMEALVINRSTQTAPNKSRVLDEGSY